MKKTLLLVASAIVSAGMWAQASRMDTIAYYAFPESEWMSNTSGKDVAGVNCTVDFTGIGNKASNAQEIDGIYYLKFTGDGSYVTLKPTGGEQVKPGDSVFVVMGHNSKRELGVYLKVRETGTWVSATQTANGEIVTAKAKISRDDINDDGSLSFYRKNGNTTFVRSFLVTRDPNAAAATHYFITYYDQNGKKLELDSIAVSAPVMSFKYGEADLPAVPEGMKFRGWYTANGRRVLEGETLEGDLVVYALVTPIEKATSTARYIYNLTNQYFYQDDHECFEAEGGAWTSTNDGWTFSAGGNIKLTVSDHAYVEITQNGTTSKEYYEGQNTVTFNFASETKVKNVTIYNVVSEVQKENGYYQIPANDANSLLMVLQQIEAGDKIFLPNGVYDFGEKTLTEINKNNISIIGQSTEGVIIKNAAPTAGISATATLRIAKNVSGTYLQDLTIENDFDYYKNNEGQAVTLWDQGTRTVCKNVRLLSYQDTYYSNLQGAVKYFEDCEIHGTVDFICGDGSVYFKNNLLVGEKRNTAGTGSIALTANNGVETDKGYVFEGCTVQSKCAAVSLGRAWNNTPKAAFLNTLVDYSEGEFAFESNGIQRWTKELMSETTLWPVFGEYNTHLADGTVLTPTTNVVTFNQKAPKTGTQDQETVLSAEQAATYTMEYTLGDWAATAKADATQAVALPVAADGIYLVENPDGNCFITTGEILNMADLIPGATIRKANARGGFGLKAGDKPEGVENTKTAEAVKAVKVVRNGQVVIIRDGKEFNVLGAEL